MPMRVCLDAHMVGNQETGNETYVAELAAALARLPGVECVAAVRPGTPLPGRWTHSQPHVVKLHPDGNWLRLAYTLPHACRVWRADILHVTYVAPFVSPCPVVVTVHDVAFRRFPGFFSARDRILFATLLPLSLRRASAIITDSESSRRDIAKFYPFAAGKTHVVPLATHLTFHPDEWSTRYEALCRQYGISPPFILAVGNLQPRKNLRRLVAAFRRLLAEGFAGYQLVLAGKEALHASRFRAEVIDLLQSGKLVRTGYVPAADLSALYCMASVFVYPSIYEGFGLPVLEAMACGTPVVASNTSALPEVAGNAALLVDPYQEDQIAQAIAQILTDPDLVRSLIVEELRQAQRFSWHETAQRTVAVYETVLGQHRH